MTSSRPGSLFSRPITHLIHDQNPREGGGEGPYRGGKIGEGQGKVCVKMGLWVSGAGSA